MAHQAPISLAEVSAGYVFPPFPVRFPAEGVRAYQGVLEGKALLATGDEELVPPAGAAALGLGALLGHVALPPGTLHAAQEVTAHAPLPVGNTVTCRAAVTGRAPRGETTFLTIEFSLESPAGEVVLNGKATLLVPRA